MKIKDKKINKIVDVSRKECPEFECYWHREDPGVFTQGVGYKKSVMVAEDGCVATETSEDARWSQKGALRCRNK